MSGLDKLLEHKIKVFFDKVRIRLIFNESLPPKTNEQELLDRMIQEHLNSVEVIANSMAQNYIKEFLSSISLLINNQIDTVIRNHFEVYEQGAEDEKFYRKLRLDKANITVVLEQQVHNIYIPLLAKYFSCHGQQNQYNATDIANLVVKGASYLKNNAEIALVLSKYLPHDTFNDTILTQISDGIKNNIKYNAIEEKYEEYFLHMLWIVKESNKYFDAKLERSIGVSQKSYFSIIGEIILSYSKYMDNVHFVQYRHYRDDAFKAECHNAALAILLEQYILQEPLLLSPDNPPLLEASSTQGSVVSSKDNSPRDTLRFESLFNTTNHDMQSLILPEVANKDQYNNTGKRACTVSARNLA